MASGRTSGSGPSPDDGSPRNSGRSPRNSGRSPRNSGRDPGSPSGDSSPRSPGRSPRGGSGGRRGQKQRKALRCPQCNLCTIICPCLFCFHPDQVLVRETLIKQMQAVSKSRHVNMGLVEDQLKQDREFRMANKVKWKRRWMLFCCCLWLLLVAGSAGMVVYFALGSWSALCYGNFKQACGWPARKYFGAVFTPGQRVLIVGGMDNGTQNFGDVWEGGKDGSDFKLVTDAAPFGPRHGHALLCHPGTGELFVIGGDAGGFADEPPRPLNDVWASADGVEWTRRVASAPWLARKFMGAAIDDDGHIYIVGGQGIFGTGGINDVWKSVDGGSSWQVVTLAAPWTARHSHAFARLPGGTRPGRLYLAGGDDGRRMHDVWFSDDNGTTWELQKFTHTREMRYSVYEDRASWTPRSSMFAVADGNGLLTLTGGDTGGEGGELLSREVWQLPAPESSDIEWYARKSKDNRLNLAFPPLQWRLEGSPPWTARHGHQTFIDDEGVPYILGGEDDGGVLSDMWNMETSIDINNLQQVMQF